MTICVCVCVCVCVHARVCNNRWAKNVYVEISFEITTFQNIEKRYGDHFCHFWTTSGPIVKTFTWSEFSNWFLLLFNFRFEL